jgi:hypothetical protein
VENKIMRDIARAIARDTAVVEIKTNQTKNLPLVENKKIIFTIILQ